MEYVLAAGAVSNPEKTIRTLNRDLEMGDDVPEDVQTLVKTLVRDFGEEYNETIEDPNDVEEVLDTEIKELLKGVKKVYRNKDGAQTDEIAMIVPTRLPQTSPGQAPGHIPRHLLRDEVPKHLL